MRLLVTLYATLAFAQAGELHQAARHCEPIRMQQLLASDARLNELDESGMTPLHIAIDERQVACAGLLLKAGADPLARDGNGRTALEAADKVPGMRDWARIRLYLNMFSAGPVAHEELEPMPWSLEYSVLHRQPKVTRMLLEMGVDPNAAGANGTTPLADAALKGDLESVRLLLAAGARQTPQVRQARSPSTMPHWVITAK